MSEKGHFDCSNSTILQNFATPSPYSTFTFLGRWSLLKKDNPIPGTLLVSDFSQFLRWVTSINASFPNIFRHDTSRPNHNIHPQF